jgi:transcription termination factor Rho
LDSRTIDTSGLEAKTLAELQQLAQDLGIEGTQRMRKGTLIAALQDRVSANNHKQEAGSEAVSEPAPEATAEEQAASGNGETPGPAAPDDATEDIRPSGRASVATEASGREGPAGPSGDGEAGLRPGGPSESAGEARGGVAAPPREREGEPRPGPGRDRQGGGRRLSREDRRRVREERRERERQEREQELAEAPVRTGVLDVLPEGYGFLRTTGYLPGPTDIYVSLSQIRRFGLRKGDEVVGAVRQPKDNEKYSALLRIDSVNEMDPQEAMQRPQFEKLTPLFPNERVRLESEATAVAERIIDLIAPIGKGQRGMVVSPPKAGKTTVLKQIANGFINADPNLHMIVLLVDERPEEVTDWQRTVAAAEVVFSTFDKPPDQHIQVTELMLERAKRLAEMGRDVAILLDSITRLSRAYNLAAPASGKILSGGIDSTALYPPRRFFGAARNLEEGGSLTIIASALVETGSRMDDAIFEEFKGTGNWEIRLDRQLSEKRIFPAINVEASGTRKEELLMPTDELALVWRLRRVLHALEPAAALELLIDKIRATKSNEQFLREISKAPVS